MAKMNHPEVAKALRQIAPENSRTVSIEHRIDKQAVVGCGSANMASPAGQHALNQAPLRIREIASACHASDNEASDKFDDTP